MTIQAGQSATAADQLKIHNANGYLNLAAATNLTVAGTVLPAPTQNYNTVICTTPGTVTSILTTNVADGFVLVLRCDLITDTINFTDTAVPTAGQLALAGPFVMTGADASLTLICVAHSISPAPLVTYWVELSRTPGMTFGKAIAATIIFA